MALTGRDSGGVGAVLMADSPMSIPGRCDASEAGPVAATASDYESDVRADVGIASSARPNSCSAASARVAAQLAPPLPPVDGTAVPPLSPRAMREVLIGLNVAVTVAAGDVQIILAAMPNVTSDLGDEHLTQWLLGAYCLGNVVLMSLYGRLSDIYGRRNMLQASMLVFMIASVLCAVAGTMTQLIVFRLFQVSGDRSNAVCYCARVPLIRAKINSSTCH